MTQQGNDPTKKHRHDIGEIDHEPETAEPTIRGIQVILGASILFTAALMVYALFVAGGGS